MDIKCCLMELAQHMQGSMIRSHGTSLVKYVIAWPRTVGTFRTGFTFYFSFLQGGGGGAGGNK